MFHRAPTKSFHANLAATYDRDERWGLRNESRPHTSVLIPHKFPRIHHLIRVERAQGFLNRQHAERAFFANEIRRVVHTDAVLMRNRAALRDDAVTRRR